MAKKGQWVGRWDHGREWLSSHGVRTYFIRKTIAGKTWEVSTRRSTEAAALAEFRRFEIDPANYSPRPDVVDALYLDEGLIEMFLAWSKAGQKDGGKGNSKAWRRKQQQYLAWWAQELEGKDLKRLDLRTDIIGPLKGTSARAHRIAVVKSLFGWLRTVEHEISKGEDPVLGELKAPKRQGAQSAGTRYVPPVADVRAVIAKLAAPYKDALLVGLGTGWHTTEVCRFAADGLAEEFPKEQRRKAEWGVIGTTHKSKNYHLTRVSKAVFQAAQQLLKHGPISREWFDRAAKKACKDLGVTPFAPGAMRHVVGSFGVAATGNLQSTAGFLGHQGARMVALNYAPNAAPAKIPTPV